MALSICLARSARSRRTKAALSVVKRHSRLGLGRHRQPVARHTLDVPAEAGVLALDPATAMTRCVGTFISAFRSSCVRTHQDRTAAERSRRVALSLERVLGAAIGCLVINRNPGLQRRLPRPPARSSPTASALTRPSLTNCCTAAETPFARRALPGDGSSALEALLSGSCLR